ncbi:unnamed protein product [Amoebophrya sp. A25]|nr:unnamed protein product [Amoebophrya sp. A25]|eukprot:GSA25T00001712001.1
MVFSSVEESNKGAIAFRHTVVESILQVVDEVAMMKYGRSLPIDQMRTLVNLEAGRLGSRLSDEDVLFEKFAIGRGVQEVVDAFNAVDGLILLRETGESFKVKLHAHSVTFDDMLSFAAHLHGEAFAVCSICEDIEMPGGTAAAGASGSSGVAGAAAAAAASDIGVTGSASAGPAAAHVAAAAASAEAAFAIAEATGAEICGDIIMGDGSPCDEESGMAHPCFDGQQVVHQQHQSSGFAPASSVSSSGTDVMSRSRRGVVACAGDSSVVNRNNPFVAGTKAAKRESGEGLLGDIDSERLMELIDAEDLTTMIEKAPTFGGNARSATPSRLALMNRIKAEQRTENAHLSSTTRASDGTQLLEEQLHQHLLTAQMSAASSTPSSSPRLVEGSATKKQKRGVCAPPPRNHNHRIKLEQPRSGAASTTNDSRVPVEVVNLCERGDDIRKILLDLDSSSGNNMMNRSSSSSPGSRGGAADGAIAMGSFMIGEPARSGVAAKIGGGDQYQQHGAPGLPMPGPVSISMGDGKGGAVGPLGMKFPSPDMIPLIGGGVGGAAAKTFPNPFLSCCVAPNASSGDQTSVSAGSGGKRGGPPTNVLKPPGDVNIKPRPPKLLPGRSSPTGVSASPSISPTASEDSTSNQIFYNTVGIKTSKGGKHSTSGGTPPMPIGKGNKGGGPSFAALPKPNSMPSPNFMPNIPHPNSCGPPGGPSLIQPSSPPRSTTMPPVPAPMRTMPLPPGLDPTMLPSDSPTPGASGAKTMPLPLPPLLSGDGSTAQKPGPLFFPPVNGALPNSSTNISALTRPESEPVQIKAEPAPGDSAKSSPTYGPATALSRTASQTLPNKNPYTRFNKPDEPTPEVGPKPSIVKIEHLPTVPEQPTASPALGRSSSCTSSFETPQKESEEARTTPKTGEGERGVGALHRIYQAVAVFRLRHFSNSVLVGKNVAAMNALVTDQKCSYAIPSGGEAWSARGGCRLTNTPDASDPTTKPLLEVNRTNWVEAFLVLPCITSLKDRQGLMGHASPTSEWTLVRKAFLTALYRKSQRPARQLLANKAGEGSSSRNGNNASPQSGGQNNEKTESDGKILKTGAGGISTARVENSAMNAASAPGGSAAPLQQASKGHNKAAEQDGKAGSVDPTGGNVSRPASGSISSLGEISRASDEPESLKGGPAHTAGGSASSSASMTGGSSKDSYKYGASLNTSGKGQPQPLHQLHGRGARGKQSVSSNKGGKLHNQPKALAFQMGGAPGAYAFSAPALSIAARPTTAFGMPAGKTAMAVLDPVTQQLQLVAAPAGATALVQPGQQLLLPAQPASSLQLGNALQIVSLSPGMKGALQQPPNNLVAQQPGGAASAPAQNTTHLLNPGGAPANHVVLAAGGTQVLQAHHSGLQLQQTPSLQPTPVYTSSPIGSPLGSPAGSPLNSPPLTSQQALEQALQNATIPGGSCSSNVSPVLSSSSGIPPVVSPLGGASASDHIVVPPFPASTSLSSPSVVTPTCVSSSSSSASCGVNAAAMVRGVPGAPHGSRRTEQHQHPSAPIVDTSMGVAPLPHAASSPAAMPSPIMGQAGGGADQQSSHSATTASAFPLASTVAAGPPHTLIKSPSTCSAGHLSPSDSEAEESSCDYANRDEHPQIPPSSGCHVDRNIQTNVGGHQSASSSSSTTKCNNSMIAQAGRAQNQLLAKSAPSSGAFAGSTAALAAPGAKNAPEVGREIVGPFEDNSLMAVGVASASSCSTSSSGPGPSTGVGRGPFHTAAPHQTQYGGVPASQHIPCQSNPQVLGSQHQQQQSGRSPPLVYQRQAQHHHQHPTTMTPQHLGPAPAARTNGAVNMRVQQQHQGNAGSAGWNSGGQQIAARPRNHNQQQHIAAGSPIITSAARPALSLAPPLGQYQPQGTPAVPLGGHYTFG